jgi:hypothetical protein
MSITNISKLLSQTDSSILITYLPICYEKYKSVTIFILPDLFCHEILIQWKFTFSLISNLYALLNIFERILFDWLSIDDDFRLIVLYTNQTEYLINVWSLLNLFLIETVKASTDLSTIDTTHALDFFYWSIQLCSLIKTEYVTWSFFSYKIGILIRSVPYVYFELSKLFSYVFKIDVILKS